MKYGKIYLGTSGWHYKHWVGTFYPTGTKSSEMFDHYKRYFTTVEINNSFYRLPPPETFTAWRKQSPKNFLFVVKANRFITHQKKLLEPEQTTKQFLENITYLNDKLGPILFQLPPHWKVNVERLEAFIKALPRKFNYVFEFRNHTWYTPEVYDVLEKHNCSFCIYELAGHTSPLIVTANFIYVRLHGPGAKYQGSYSDRRLSEWARVSEQWLAQGRNVFIYFDNDQLGYAAKNANTLKAMIEAK